MKNSSCSSRGSRVLWFAAAASGLFTLLLSEPLFAAAATPQAAIATNAWWMAGAAAADITPAEPVWFAGFGGRTKPSEDVAQRLFTKVLAIEDRAKTRMVFVTMDVCEVTRRIHDSVTQQAAERFKLPSQAILLNCSHTHCGPAVSGYQVRYIRGDVVDSVMEEKAEAYGRLVADRIVSAIGEALSRLSPATLHYTHARAGFAMNRRLREGSVYRNSPNPEGPVDHDVPVLKVTTSDGRVKAILFGYACHNTVVPAIYSINGDYAGYAQAYLEEMNPGAVALFMMGTGGDQNPYPRGTLQLAAEHGRTLANAVSAALGVKEQRQLHGPLRSALGDAQLDYAEIDQVDLERRAQRGDKVEKARAAAVLGKLAAGETLPKSGLCPVQVVQFGADLTFVAIGGETTVDYSLRLKRELGQQAPAVWVAGYNNDIFGYLGSRRVILEGGYEGYSSNLSYGYDDRYGDRPPGPFATTTEERVIGKVYDLLRTINH